MISDIISQIEDKRQHDKEPWRRISDCKDCFLYDTLDLLEQLKDFEISEEKAFEMLTNNGYEVDAEDVEQSIENLTLGYDEHGTDLTDNTYNYNCNITDDIWYNQLNGVAMLHIHLGGDVRGNYTDPIYIDLRGESNFIVFANDYLDTCKNKPINDEYVAEIDAFNQAIIVYDNNQEEVCVTYETEREDILNDLKEKLNEDIERD